MDRELTTRERRGRLLRRALPAAGALALASLALAALPRLLMPGVERSNIRIATVERGAVTRVVEASGLVEPASERLLTSPVDARLLRVLRRPGEPVKAGDAILELDVTAAQVALARQDDHVATLRLDAEQARLGIERGLDDLRGRAQSRSLERDVARTRFERAEKLRAEGLVSAETLDERRLDLERAGIDAANLARSLLSEEQAGRARLDSLALQLQQAERDRDEQARQLAMAGARAEEDGVVTWVLDDIGRSVRQGEALARVARLDSYVVRGTVSDVHARDVWAGQRVRVRTSDFEIAGQVETVNPQVESGAVSFTVALAEPSRPELRPSLRVDAWVVGESREDVLRVERAAGTGGSARAGVFVVEGDVARRRDVVFGFEGPDAVEIASGLDEGEQVIVSDMSDHAHADVVRIH